MCRSQLNSLQSTVYVVLLFTVFSVSALEFEPGVGVGLEYTNNAALTPDNELNDLIAVGYVGASLKEDNGPVRADATASLSHNRYTKDTFDDRRYFNLGLTTEWEMVKNRFDWLLQDYYQQRPISTFDPTTPDNIQDSNIFTFGADINIPISARQSLMLLPEYKNFYYEIQTTDNQQYSLLATWNYQMNRLTNVGLNASVRTIDYDQPLVEDVTFSSVFLAVSTTRARSDFSTNLGSTHVERSSGQSTQEFAGSLNWLLNMTGRSRFRTFISTNLTDSSSSALSATVDPGTGNPNDIQITRDVIRNKILTLGYSRTDGILDSSLSGQLRELNYSESPNDRRIRSLTAAFNYPVTALLTSEVRAYFNNTDFIDIDRTDNEYTIDGNIRYQLSRMLNSSFSLKYRNRDSTVETQNFEEWSAYINLVYGFGETLRPTSAGGF